MPELIERGWTDADAGPLANLINAIESHAGGHPGWTAANIRTHLVMVLDHERDIRLFVDAKGTLVAAALVGTPPPDGYRADLSGGVHPDWRGRGLGRDLLGWQLARIGELHRAARPTPPWQAHVTCLLADTSAQALYTRMKMTPLRYWIDMVASIGEMPADAHPIPDGLRVVGYEPRHELGTYQAHQAAFADHWGFQHRELPEWLSLSVRSASFRPELSAVALAGDNGVSDEVADGEVIGLALCYRDANPTRLYVGHVAVTRPWRRRGVAAALLADVLRRAGAVGLTRAALGVDADSPTGAVSVYQRVGFEADSRAVTYSADLPLGDA